MAAMEELGTLLQSLQALKPPGITKTKIDAITAKCVENVQSDTLVVFKIVQQFKNSAATHKLGVLYVIDSVTRQWVEKARSSGQAVSKNAAPGTFASGVQQVTDALPVLMTDLIQVAPDNQKEKISKLLDIWERGQTFPISMLSSFKNMLNAPRHAAPSQPHSSPQGLTIASQGFGIQSNTQPVFPPAPSAAPDSSALLATLVGMPQQNSQTNLPPSAQLPFPFPSNVAPPPPFPGFVPPPPPIVAPAQTMTPELMLSTIFQALSSGQIPAEQGYQLIAAVAGHSQQQQSGALAAPPPQMPMGVNNVLAAPNAQSSAQPERFEQNGHRFRDRSRSPDYSHHRGQSPMRRTPPNRRDSPTYGTYDPNAAAEGNSSNRNDRERGRGRGKQRGRGRDEFRQRTPPAQRRLPSPPQGSSGLPSGQPKYLEWDKSLPPDHIKVLSRTLFIGGAGGTEGEIRNIFSRFGKVQTCIVNQDKRHAFVKMVNRQDAVAAKKGMDNLQDPAALSKARQTRWGVGFGPRDCSDYTTGISIIPISRLTDADRKWVLTAEYGGTGGITLEGGMVMEEPDIEIGAGVSSKAISRRVPPDGGRRGGYGHAAGPRGGGGGGSENPRFRKEHRPSLPEPRHISPRPEPSIAVPPAVPGFGFQLPGF